MSVSCFANSSFSSSESLRLASFAVFSTIFASITVITLRNVVTKYLANHKNVGTNYHTHNEIIKLVVKYYDLGSIKDENGYLIIKLL